MKPKTMILMVVAVVCGLGASYMTSRLLAERQQPAEDTVMILVAKQKVPAFIPTKDPKKYFEPKQYLITSAPKKALKDYAQVQAQLSTSPWTRTSP